MVSPFLHLSRFPIHLSPLFPRSKYWPYPSRETPCPILPLVRLAPLAKVIVSRGWLTTPPDAVSKEIVSCWMLSVGSQGLEKKNTNQNHAVTVTTNIEVKRVQWLVNKNNSRKSDWFVQYYDTPVKIISYQIIKMEWDMRWWQQYKQSIHVLWKCKFYEINITQALYICKIKSYQLFLE